MPSALWNAPRCAAAAEPRPARPACDDRGMPPCGFRRHSVPWRPNGRHTARDERLPVRAQSL